jgi:hypothetical protein
MASLREPQSVVSGTNRILLSDDEILLLDDYFTHRVGYIGREHPADVAAYSFADIVADRAEEIRANNRAR